MTIVVLTNTLQNGTLADATEVMADLQQIVNVVNGELQSENVEDGSLHATDMAVGPSGLASQAVSVRRTATQAIVGGPPVKVQLNSEDFDVSAVFDAATNNRYTPQVGGVYRVAALSSWVAFNFYIGLLVYKNGALYQRLSLTPNTSTVTGVTSGGSCLVAMNGSTDYLELFAEHGESGVTHDLSWAYFCAELVGRT
jgi:hypothetical protein